MRAIISGGGTGGHIFPAIAIADEIKKRNAESELLFVGAKGRMEMNRVPNAGYRIVGLPIIGIRRKLTWKNVLVPFRLLASLWKARGILREFKPDVVIGVGGYASGPTLKMACWMGVPTLIQEQNSFPGITNRLLGSKVDRVCVAYEDMDRYFLPDKIRLTGNPVRGEILDPGDNRELAKRFFELGLNKKTLLIFGGSLGARTLNEAVRKNLQLIEEYPDYLVIWQVGAHYYDEYRKIIPELPNLRITPFIERMELAYSLADLIVCRAGALTISELAIVGKAAILVPSPNVAEDHQTKNALRLVNKNAAVHLTDGEARSKLLPEAMKLLEDDARLREMGHNIKQFARPRATQKIVDEIEQLIVK